MTLAHLCKDVQFLGHDSCWSVTRSVWSRAPNNGTKADRKCRADLRHLTKQLIDQFSPLWKFIFWLFFYGVFIGIYSYVILERFVPYPLSPDNVGDNMMELLILLYVVGMVLEEWREVLQGGERLARYLYSDWNKVDALAIVLYSVGIGLQHNISTYEWALVLRALAFVFFFAKILRFLCLSRWLGHFIPLLGQLRNEFVKFFIVLTIFNTAYMIGMQAVINPQYEWRAQDIHLIILPPYSYVFGEVDDTFLEGSYDLTTADNRTMTIPTSLTTDWIYPFGRFLQIIVTHFMLFNILISIFSVKFEAVHREAEAHYRYQFLQVTREYYYHSWLPSPLCLLFGYSIFVYYPQDPFNERPDKKSQQKNKSALFKISPETLHDFIREHIKGSEADDSHENKLYILNLHRTNITMFDESTPAESSANENSWDQNNNSTNIADILRQIQSVKDDLSRDYMTHMTALDDQLNLLRTAAENSEVERQIS